MKGIEWKSITAQSYEQLWKNFICIVKEGVVMDVKVYVDVLAQFSKDGVLVPKTITWEDGQTYEVTKVLDVRRAASTRAGGVGERYTCIVSGQQVHLYYEENNLWFMERKTG